MTKAPRLTDREKLIQLTRNDPTMWRHTVAIATTELLEAGETVTAQSLIAHIRAGFATQDPVVNEGTSDAAIARLQAILDKQETGDPGRAP